MPTREEEDQEWVQRINLVDLYPRRQDPFMPPVAVTPATGPAASFQTEEELRAQLGAAQDPISILLTQPGQRPTVYQRAANFQFNADVTALPISNLQFLCDTIVIDVPSTAGASVFFGFGNGITIASGIEVRPGLPIAIQPENTREQWEIQRLLEMIAYMMAIDKGFNMFNSYKAPRVAFDASQWFIVAAAPLAIRIMLFTIPEQQ